MIKHFDEINFNHLPQEENQMADALATLVDMFQVNSSGEVQPIRMKLNETPADKGQICIEFNLIYLVFCVVYHLFWTF